MRIRFPLPFERSEPPIVVSTTVSSTVVVFPWRHQVVIAALRGNDLPQQLVSLRQA
jgi:hypothetical protein